jgi:proteasome lid subunit RPN8/RPN11
LYEVDLSAFDSGTNTEERCGVVLQSADGDYNVFELENRSPNPKNRFVISKADAAQIDKRHGVIVGVVHTHPFRSMRTASQHDINSIPAGLFGIVYHPSTGSKVWYDHNGVTHEDLKRRRQHG